MMRPPLRGNPLMTASSLNARRVRIKSSVTAELARDEAVYEKNIGALGIDKTGIICVVTFEEFEMSTSPGTPTLDQLRVFLTVVETGSFAGAARKLGRATSVISYTIANLEAQLGLSVFDRQSTRTPQLTDAGRAVVAEARAVTNGVDGLRAKARGLLQGVEAEIHLVIDVMLPGARVVDALKAFRAEFPTVALRLYVEALGMMTQMVLDGRATIGVSGPLEIAGIERVSIGSVEHIPVAAPDHPLALAGRNAPGAGRNHIQLVLTDRSSLTRGRDFGVIGAETWRLADLGAKHMLLKGGIGWGYMPEPTVRDDVAAGRLVHLNMPEMRSIATPLFAIYRTDNPPGPAGSWLIARFQAQAADTDECGDDQQMLQASPPAAGRKRATAR
jgi:DNA-binding transcriptional LysR family regulator